MPGSNPQTPKTGTDFFNTHSPSHSLTARISHGRVVAFSATVQLHFYGKPVTRPSDNKRVLRYRLTLRTMTVELDIECTFEISI